MWGGLSFTCHQCKQGIHPTEIYYIINDAAFHFDHFVCCDCHVKIGTQTFYPKHSDNPDEKAFYCAGCYGKTCPVCASCNNPIVEEVLYALGKSWHREHLCCAGCGVNVAYAPFYVHGGLPYCPAELNLIRKLQAQEAEERAKKAAPTPQVPKPQSPRVPEISETPQPSEPTTPTPDSTSPTEPAQSPTQPQEPAPPTSPKQPAPPALPTQPVPTAFTRASGTSQPASPKTAPPKLIQSPRGSQAPPQPPSPRGSQSPQPKPPAQQKQPTQPTPITPPTPPTPTPTQPKPTTQAPPSPRGTQAIQPPQSPRALPQPIQKPPTLPTPVPVPIKPKAPSIAQPPTSATPPRAIQLPKPPVRPTSPRRPASPDVPEVPDVPDAQPPPVALPTALPLAIPAQLEYSDSLDDLSIDDEKEPCEKICTCCGGEIMGEFLRCFEQYWLPEHFACTLCHQKINPGSRFSESENRIFCSEDHLSSFFEEREKEPEQGGGGSKSRKIRLRTTVAPKPTASRQRARGFIDKTSRPTSAVPLEAPTLKTLGLASPNRRPLTADPEIVKATGAPATLDVPKPRVRKESAILMKQIHAKKHTMLLKRYSLFITVLEAKNAFHDENPEVLPNMYCVAECGAQKQETRIIWKNIAPYWGENFTFNVMSLEDRFSAVFSVFDRSKKGVKCLGKAEVPLKLFADQHSKEQYYTLSPATESLGMIRVFLLLDKPKNPKLTVKIVGTKNVPDAESIESYVSVHFGAAEKKTKMIKKTALPLWNEEFEFEAGENFQESEVLVQLWANGLMKKMVGQVVLPLANVKPEVPRESWHALQSKTASKSHNGDLRLQFKYMLEIILPSDRYTRLLEIISEDKFSMVDLLGKVSEEKELLTQVLISVFRYQGQIAPFLESFVSQEVQSTPDPNVLFRGNTITTKLVERYLKDVGVTYLKETLSPIISALHTSKKSLEVDPKKGLSTDECQKNFANLQELVSNVLSSIFNSAASLPLEFRRLFCMIREEVMKKFPDKAICKYTAIAGFLFLRFYCPALTSPKLFALTQEHPKQKKARALTLVAKTLQNLANMVEFGNKEKYMEGMNPLLLSNFDKMKAFIDQISTPVTQPIVEEKTELVERQMYILFHQLVLSFSKMQPLLQSQPQNTTQLEILERMKVVLTEMNDKYFFRATQLSL